MSKNKPVPEFSACYFPAYLRRIAADAMNREQAGFYRRYQVLGRKIHATFAQRNEDQNAIELVIKLCKKQIALSFDYAQSEYQDRVPRQARCLRYAENCADDAEQRQRHLQAADRVMNYKHDQSGYQRLVKIYEKQRRYEEALKYAVKAKSECWYKTHNWDKTIFRLHSRVAKLSV